MHRLFIASLWAAAITLWGMVASTAILPLVAQDTVVTAEPGAVSFLQQIVLLLVPIIFSGVVLPLAIRGFSLINLKMEQSQRDSLQTGFGNLAGRLINDFGEAAARLQIDVKDPRLAGYIKQAQQRFPDALRWAGLTEEVIAKRAGAGLAKLHLDEAIAGRILEQVPAKLALLPNQTVSDTIVFPSPKP